jgi:SAM-dependent methyltransferase
VNNYFIRDGYTPRLQPDYFHDVKPDGKTWQPDVLAIAAHLARANGATRLVDIGCGRGTGLTPYSREFDVVGIDYGANIEYCQSAYDWGTWLELDLEQEPTEMLLFNDSVVVCSDVIEHLVQPDYLLLTLKASTVCAKSVVLSTPDRLRTYGRDQDGPPGNPHHTREWTLDEMTALLESYGLNIAWRGWTISNNVDRLKNTMLLILTRRGIVYNMQEMLTQFDVEQK